MKDIILKVDNVSYKIINGKSSENNSIELIKNISFKIERNKVIGISGESGSGKTTLAKIISGIINHSSGKIESFFSKDWNSSNPKPIQILFQNDGNLINPFRKVNSVLNEAFELKNNKNADYSERVKKIFELFNLKEELLNRIGIQLSGGEQQRIALARVMIVEPEILILDEPFSSQDVEAQLTVLKLLQKLKQEFDVTIICITHDLQILKKIADEILIMFNGKIVERGSALQIFENPNNEYTKFLLKAQTFKLSKEEINSFHKSYEQD